MASRKNEIIIGIIIAVFILFVVFTEFMPQISDTTSQQIPDDSPWSNSQQNPDESSRMTNEATSADFWQLIAIIALADFVGCSIIFIGKLAFQ